MLLSAPKLLHVMYTSVSFDVEVIEMLMTRVAKKKKKK